MLTRQELTLKEETLQESLLPRLLGTVFHVTSAERFRLIEECGALRANADGALGNTFAPSRRCVGRLKGWVCLFDLRNPADEALHWGMSCLYFLAPRELGNHLAFLRVDAPAYGRLLTQPAARKGIDPSFMFIPDVECWYPGDLPLTLIADVLLVTVIRRPVDPHSLLGVLEAMERPPGTPRQA